MRIYQSTGRAQTVVEREDALLTPEETNKHWPAVLTAMYEELQTWVKYGCISRKPRNQARNIIDVKWVKKWKFEQAARSVEDSRTKGPADTKRIIRARLTVRGFKDLDAKGLDNYAGTSQRYSQRALVSEAVRRGWDICTTDISKAFLHRGFVQRTCRGYR